MENVFKNEDGTYKEIVLKKTSIAKVKTTKEILGVNVEYIFKGETKHRELFLNVILLMEFIRTSDNGCNECLAMVNRNISDAIYDTVGKIEANK